MSQVLGVPYWFASDSNGSKSVFNQKIFNKPNFWVGSSHHAGSKIRTKSGLGPQGKKFGWFHLAALNDLFYIHEYAELQTLKKLLWVVKVVLPIVFLFNCNKIIKTEFKFPTKINLAFSQTPIVSRAKSKWYKKQKQWKIEFKFTTTDFSNFDKRWSDAHFVSLLSYYYCSFRMPEPIFQSYLSFQRAVTCNATSLFEDWIPFAPGHLQGVNWISLSCQIKFFKVNITQFLQFSFSRNIANSQIHSYQPCS